MRWGLDGMTYEPVQSLDLPGPAEVVGIDDPVNSLE